MAGETKFFSPIIDDLNECLKAKWQSLVIHAYFKADVRLIYKTASRDIGKIRPNIQSIVDELSIKS
ncbi:hypothetical protein ACKUB1_17075 [Methanospirillum stamsii]